MTDRIFSVMKKRDDLPEMNLPLAVLFMLGSAVFAAAAAKIASPADSTSVFSSTSIVGIAASLPFLPLAGCLYSLLILLWRRMLSLLATPVMFLAMLAFGADIFPSAVISVSLLFVSYVYAVSLIGRENRFRRIACLAMSAALCIVLTLIAKLGIVFDSFSGFTRAFMSEIPALMSQAASSYIGAASGENITLDPELFASAARDILIMIPAYIGVLSIVIAWFMDFLASSAFRVLDCEDVFIEITPSVSLPFSYAAVYAAVFVMFVLTASDSSPMLTMMFRSVLYVMLPPCTAVGIHTLMLFLEDKLYHLSRERVLAAIILFFALAILGISSILLVTSAVGSAAVILRKLKSRKNGTQDNIQ